jgi:hypothetical protein
MKEFTFRLILLVLVLRSATTSAQSEWGVVVGGNVSYFDLVVAKNDQWTTGTADGHGGLCLAAQYSRVDTIGPNWLAFELEYTQRMADVQAVYAYKVGMATTKYKVEYGTLTLGYLPRFQLFQSQRWYIVSGLRAGWPVRVKGSGYEEVTGGLAGPPDYYAYSTFTDRSSFKQVFDLQLRSAFMLEHAILVGDGRLLAIGLGFDQSLTAQKVRGGAKVSNTDLCLRLSYRMHRKVRAAP